MEAIILSLFEGFLVGAGLIVAIGAQNAFVLKQGLKKNHVLATALFCALADASLIAVGVGGLGEVFTSSRILLHMAKWGGATFLFWYGFGSFRAAFSRGRLNPEDAPERGAHSLKKHLFTLAAITFLNPHVYLDTVVLLGSIGSQLESGERVFFAAGAMAASIAWFFGLSYGARLLVPILKNETSWKVIDCIIGCIMWAIGISLLIPSRAFCHSP